MAAERSGFSGTGSGTRHIYEKPGQTIVGAGVFVLTSLRRRVVFVSGHPASLLGKMLNECSTKLV